MYLLEELLVRLLVRASGRRLHRSGASRRLLVLKLDVLVIIDLHARRLLRRDGVAVYRAFRRHSAVSATGGRRLRGAALAAAARHVLRQLQVGLTVVRLGSLLAQRVVDGRHRRERLSLESTATGLLLRGAGGLLVRGGKAAFLGRRSALN